MATTDLSQAHPAPATRWRRWAKVLAVPALSAAALTAGLAASGAQAADKDKKADAEPKYTIKEVMQKAHKGDDALRTKVLEGKASEEDKKMLLELYKAMPQNEPPKGDKASWAELTGKLVEAGEAVAKDAPDAKQKLEAATNCKACHSKHKGG